MPFSLPPLLHCQLFIFLEMLCCSPILAIFVLLSLCTMYCIKLYSNKFTTLCVRILHFDFLSIPRVPTFWLVFILAWLFFFFCLSFFLFAQSRFMTVHMYRGVQTRVLTEFQISIATWQQGHQHCIRLTRPALQHNLVLLSTILFSSSHDLLFLNVFLSYKGIMKFQLKILLKMFTCFHSDVMQSV